VSWPTPWWRHAAPPLSWPVTIRRCAISPALGRLAVTSRAQLRRICCSASSSPSAKAGVRRKRASREIRFGLRSARASRHVARAIDGSSRPVRPSERREQSAQVTNPCGGGYLRPPRREESLPGRPTSAAVHPLLRGQAFVRQYVRLRSQALADYLLVSRWTRTAHQKMRMCATVCRKIRATLLKLVLDANHGHARGGGAAFQHRETQRYRLRVGDQHSRAREREIVETSMRRRPCRRPAATPPTCGGSIG
jgi:hypothetical protein